MILLSYALAQRCGNCCRAIRLHAGRLMRDRDSASFTGACHDWSLEPGDAEATTQMEPATAIEPGARLPGQWA